MNYKPKANDEGKENNAIFFRNLAEVKTKYRRAVHRMSLKTFQAARRIILKFNRELDKKPREILEEVSMIKLDKYLSTKRNRTDTNFVVDKRNDHFLYFPLNITDRFLCKLFYSFKKVCLMALQTFI